MDAEISTVLTALVGTISDNALPIVALVLGLLIVPAIGISAAKMVYRKAKGLVS